jgi:hypothetical protein
LLYISILAYFTSINVKLILIIKNVMMQKPIERDALEAMMEMKRLRETIHPLTALFLVMDYTQVELESAISKIDSKIMDRLDIRFEVARKLLERQRMKLNDIERNPIVSSPTLQEPYTIETAAIAIGLSKASVRNAINNGTLNFNDVSVTGKRRSIRISPKDVEEFIKHKK